MVAVFDRYLTDKEKNLCKERQEDDMKADEMARLVYEALADKKGEDIRILDISEISVMADYFIIVEGSSQPQIQALVDSVEEKLGEAGCQMKRREGSRNSTWILMDYGDVVVHIFDKEDRLFYNLERIWSDGREVAPSEL